MKIKAVAVTLIIFILTQLLSWLLRPIWFFKWESEILGFSFTGGALNIAITLLLIYFTKKEFKSYGFKREKWESSVDTGLFSWLFLIIPVIILLYFGLDYTRIIDSLVMSAITIVSLMIFLLVLKRQERKDSEGEDDPEENKTINTKLNLILFAGLLCFPIILAIILTFNFEIIGRVISILSFQVIFSGFGEEMRYRGYFQPRINEDLGTPYSFLGVSFGPGLLIAALFFGISHIFNSFSPFEGIFTLQWGWGIYAFSTGIFYGFIKEKTQNIIGPGISHSFDAFGQALTLLFG
jgi:membrane protease YdiL (CAAX protease family)